MIVAQPGFKAREQVTRESFVIARQQEQPGGLGLLPFVHNQQFAEGQRVLKSPLTFHLLIKLALDAAQFGCRDTKEDDLLVRFEIDARLRGRALVACRAQPL